MEALRLTDIYVVPKKHNTTDKSARVPSAVHLEAFAHSEGTLHRVVSLKTIDEQVHACIFRCNLLMASAAAAEP